MSQELTRAPLSNMVPDYQVYGPELAYKGMGGILAAGFWGSDWSWRPDATHTLC